MKVVILESPYAGLGASSQDIEKNVEYARACIRDCLKRGEAPFASHLLYTQEGILDDKVPEERKLGMEAGFAWIPKAEASVVYTDRGISKGMEEGIKRAEENGLSVEYRKLYP